jgi:type II secretory pathway pseudopilin PulG
VRGETLMNILKKEDGFTLIEMIISFTIIIILIATFSRAVLVGLKSEVTTSNLDYASSFSSSIFDFLADANNFKNIIENEIDISSGKYENKIDDFIENDLEFTSNPDIKDDFVSILKKYTDNKRFNYLNKSKIVIEEVTGINRVNNLYRIKLFIYWQEKDSEGKYEIATMIGAD